MTTFTILYAEDIYIKGQPLENLSGSGVSSEVTNSIATINAIFNGLAGGQTTPSQPAPNIQARLPSASDDTSNNWDVGSIWVYDSTAYVNIDNTERNAKWKIASVEIDDLKISESNTYSSKKITDDSASATTTNNYRLSQKSNIADVNIALSAKASNIL